MMGQLDDPHLQLGKALSTLAACRICDSHETPWASATFAGAWHRFVLELENRDDRVRFADVQEREFTLRGHLVADIVLIPPTGESDESYLTIEALTVEEA